MAHSSLGLLMFFTCCLVTDQLLNISAIVCRCLGARGPGQSQCTSTSSSELSSSYLPAWKEFGLSTLTEVLPDGMDGLSLNEVRYLEPRLLTPLDYSESPKHTTHVYFHAFSPPLGTCFFSPSSKKIILYLHSTSHCEH